MVPNVLTDWPFEPWVLAGVVVSSLVYVRGWWILRRRDRQRWPASRLAAFLGGQACIYLALASPLEVLADQLLQAHMAQHLLLMMAAPPLLWLGAPLFPLLRGLPADVRSAWAVPFLQAPWVVSLARKATEPVAAWVIFTATTWAWHLPRMYELAVASEFWHYIQHACFLGTALLFWFPIIRPYPSRPRWSPWLLLPYLFLADVQNTILSALFAFSSRPWYPSYAIGPRLWNITPLDDQATAGVLMWVPGSVVYLVPLFAIAVRLLFGDRGAGFQPVSAPGRLEACPTKSRIALPLISQSSPQTDLLRLPLLGRLLKWRYARLIFQMPLLLLAIVVIWDGLTGPTTGSHNLAGVLPWIHWRGCLVVGLLVLGNLFCMGCPFMVPRALARRFLPARHSWPPWLKGKWPAILLLLLFFWAYEAFALWDRPAWTALIALGYFLGALVLDSLFRGAPFCKHVCPIGQFNFVQSLLSPFEVRVRERSVCVSCQTKDCIRGRAELPGCELGLFLPRKAGNLDCTACLACVHACPHDNVGILAVVPGAELVRDPQRSGIGRFSRRRDLAVLVVVLVFAAFVNAAGMVRPIVRQLASLSAEFGFRSQIPVLSAAFLLAMFVLPAALVGAASALARFLGKISGTVSDVATRSVYVLIPLGFAMWLAHYGFHLVTSYEAAAPVVQRVAGDLGWEGLGGPEWVAWCCRPEPPWLHDLEILCLFVGLLGTLHVARRLTLNQAPNSQRAWAALLPWALLALLMFGAGGWVLSQPMEMRGSPRMSSTLGN